MKTQFFRKFKITLNAHKIKTFFNGGNDMIIYCFLKYFKFLKIFIVLERPLLDAWIFWMNYRTQTLKSTGTIW